MYFLPECVETIVERGSVIGEKIYLSRRPLVRWPEKKSSDRLQDFGSNWKFNFLQPSLQSFYSEIIPMLNFTSRTLCRFLFVLRSLALGS